jgi:hypothetical protein
MLVYGLWCLMPLSTIFQFSDTLIHIVSHGKAKVEKRKSIKILKYKTQKHRKSRRTIGDSLKPEDNIVG